MKTHRLNFSILEIPLSNLTLLRTKRFYNVLVNGSLAGKKMLLFPSLQKSRQATCLNFMHGTAQPALKNQKQL